MRQRTPRDDRSGCQGVRRHDPENGLLESFLEAPATTGRGQPVVDMRTCAAERQPLSRSAVSLTGPNRRPTTAAGRVLLYALWVVSQLKRGEVVLSALACSWADGRAHGWQSRSQCIWAASRRVHQGVAGRLARCRLVFGGGLETWEPPARGLRPCISFTRNRQ
jgi:hypothetical protein